MSLRDLDPNPRSLNDQNSVNETFTNNSSSDVVPTSTDHYNTPASRDNIIEQITTILRLLVIILSKIMLSFLTAVIMIKALLMSKKRHLMTPLPHVVPLVSAALLIDMAIFLSLGLSLFSTG